MYVRTNLSDVFNRFPRYTVSLSYFPPTKRNIVKYEFLTKVKWKPVKIIEVFQQLLISFS